MTKKESQGKNLPFLGKGAPGNDVVQGHLPFKAPRSTPQIKEQMETQNALLAQKHGKGRGSDRDARENRSRESAEPKWEEENKKLL